MIEPPNLGYRPANGKSQTTALGIFVQFLEVIEYDILFTCRNTGASIGNGENGLSCRVVGLISKINLSLRGKFGSVAQ